MKTSASAEYAFQKDVVHNPLKELILEAYCQLVDSTSAEMAASSLPYAKEFCKGANLYVVYTNSSLTVFDLTMLESVTCLLVEGNKLLSVSLSFCLEHFLVQCFLLSK